MKQALYTSRKLGQYHVNKGSEYDRHGGGGGYGSCPKIPCTLNLYVSGITKQERIFSRDETSSVFDLCRELVSCLEKIRCCFVIPDTYKFRVHGIFGHEP